MSQAVLAPQKSRFSLNRAAETVIGVACIAGAIYVIAPQPAQADLNQEVQKVRTLTTALLDVCAGATDATVLVTGIHYFGKFIKYALG